MKKIKELPLTRKDLKNREESSINKLDDIIHGNVKGVYGLGKERTMKDYEYISGVDLVNKVVTTFCIIFINYFFKNYIWCIFFSFNLFYFIFNF